MRSEPWATLALVGLIGFACSAGCGESASDGKSTPRYVDYIRDDTFTRLVGEVDYVDGSGPADSVLGSIGDEFEGFLEKPDGIEFSRDQTIESRGADHTWTTDELEDAAESSFDRSVPEHAIKMQVLYVDGGYEGDTDSSSVLGLAWGHRNIAIFEDNIEESCGEGSIGPDPLADRLCRKVEKSVLTHEIGHTIGLVNNGLEPIDDHHDAEHGAHCDVEDCVMYWKARRSEVVDRIRDRFHRGDESALGFKESCRRDVAEVRDE